MDSQKLRNRTKQLALQIIKLVALLARNRTGNVLGCHIFKVTAEKHSVASLKRLRVDH